MSKLLLKPDIVEDGGIGFNSDELLNVILLLPDIKGIRQRI